MSPEEKKLEKLNALFELVNQDFATPDDLIKFSEAILNIITTEKERQTGELEDAKGKTAKEIKATLSLLDEKERGLKNIITQLATETDRAIAQASTSLSKEIKRVEGKIPTKTDLSALEADIKALSDGLNNLPTEFTINNEAIRDGLELLQGDERLDKSAIKGLDELIEELRTSNKPIAAAGVRLLRYLADVNIDGITNGQTLIWDAATGKFIPGSGGTGGGHTIEDEGTPLTQRTNLNFVGAGVTVTDDAGNDRTIVTIPGGSAGSGDVVGPASAVNNNFAAFDTTTGKLIKDSGSKASDFATALGADDNYVTDVEKVKLSNLSGTNSGDQTTIVGITGTMAQYNTSVTDGDFMYVGDAPTAHTHPASAITDFDTEVSNNTDVAANTAARHAAVTVVDSAEIDFTLTGQQITASIIAGSIDETKLDVSTNASLDKADSALQAADATTTPTASKIVQRDASANIYANNHFSNLTSTVSAGGTTVLTVASARTQRLTGSSSQTYQLPDATTLPLSSIFEFDNNSSSSLIITNAGAATQYTVPAGGAVHCICTANGTANGSWDFHAMTPSAATWGSGITGLVMNSALTTSPSVGSGASSATAPSFIPQRGANTTGFGGDGTNLYATIAGTARATISATGITATNLSGINTGDQTTIVGITGTKAQFDTAVTDGNFLYVGDVTTNATHTGEVTGSGALTVDKTAITNKTLVTAAVGDHVLVADASDTDNLKKVTIQTIVDLAAGGGNTYFNDIFIDQSGGTSDTYGVLAGTINGSNALFTVSQSVYATGTLQVWLNGQLMTQGTGEDYVETTPASGTFTFNTAPATGSEITVAYQKVVTNSTTVVTTTTVDELAQDAVGTILTDSAEIDFTYNDGVPSITASIVASSIDETKLDVSVNASLDLADSSLQAANISDTAYASSWNGVTTVAPSKNAVYDAMITRVVRVVHGATAGTARPSDASYVEWVGSVEPTNATNDDTWITT